MSAREGCPKREGTHVNCSALSTLLLSLILPPVPPRNPTPCCRTELRRVRRVPFNDLHAPWISQSPSRSVNISSSLPSGSNPSPSPSRSVPFQCSCTQATLFTLRMTFPVDSYIRVGPLHLCPGKGQRCQSSRHSRPRRCQQCPPETNHRRLGHYAPSSKDYCAEMCATRSILVDA